MKLNWKVLECARLQTNNLVSLHKESTFKEYILNCVCWHHACGSKIYESLFSRIQSSVFVWLWNKQKKNAFAQVISLYTKSNHTWHQSLKQIEIIHDLSFLQCFIIIHYQLDMHYKSYIVPFKTLILCIIFWGDFIFCSALRWHKKLPFPIILNSQFFSLQSSFTRFDLSFYFEHEVN